MDDIITGLLAIHLIVQLLFFFFYLLWQFEKINLEEDTMVRIVSSLDFFETIILIITRFVPITSERAFFLGAYYVLLIILLGLQFVNADWGGVQKVKDVLWTTLYVLLFLIDIVHIDVFGIISANIGPTLLAIDAFLKDSWLGSVLSAILLAAFKMIFSTYGLKNGSE